MERVITDSEARLHFGEVLRRVVEDQDTVIVAHEGKPQAVILSIDEYERFRTTRPDQVGWQMQVTRAREMIQAEMGERGLVPWDEVFGSMRACNI